MKVGFVGLGAMGLGMAERINARHDLLVFNRSQSKAAGLVSNGAELVGRVDDLGQCEVVGSMLSDDNAVEAVFLDGDQLKVEFQPNTIHASHSTISPDMTLRLQEAHRAAGVRFLNAPVLGRPNKAASGELVVVAAGQRDCFEAARHVFEAFSTAQYWMGERPEQSAVAKLGVNFLVAAVLESLAEGFALTRSADIDSEHFLALLTQTIFNAPVYHAYAPLVAREAKPDPCFKTTLGLKDVSLALSEANARGVDLPMGKLIVSQLQAAILDGYGDEDWSSLARLAAKRAGLPPLDQS